MMTMGRRGKLLNDGGEPERRKATVILTSAELRISEPTPEIEWTGLETASEIKTKVKQHKLLKNQLKKLGQPGSTNSAHFVQGGLPELGKRR